MNSASLRRRIDRKVAEIEAADSITEVSSVQRLTSSSGNDYRIKIGDYRLGVTVEGEVATPMAFGPRESIHTVGIRRVCGDGVLGTRRVPEKNDRRTQGSVQ